MIDQTQYFDIYQLLVNEVFGSVILFTFVGLIILLWICTKNNLSLGETILVETIFLFIIASASVGLWTILITIVCVITGAIVFYGIYKLVNR